MTAISAAITTAIMTAISASRPGSEQRNLCERPGSCKTVTWYCKTVDGNVGCEDARGDARGLREACGSHRRNGAALMAALAARRISIISNIWFGVGVAALMAARRISILSLMAARRILSTWGP